MQRGVLAGFDRETLSGSGYDTERATALYAALDVSVEDDEYTLGTLPDGRWALVGLTTSGYEFAVERGE